MFQTVPLSVIRSFSLYNSNGICHTGLLTACEQDQDVPSWSCSQAVSKPVWHIPLLCVQRKTPDEGQRNCPKHAEFYSKNKFEKLVHLVGFIIRIYKNSYVTYTNLSLNAIFYLSMYQHNKSLNVKCFHLWNFLKQRSVLQTYVYLCDLWLLW